MHIDTISAIFGVFVFLAFSFSFVTRVANRGGFFLSFCEHCMRFVSLRLSGCLSSLFFRFVSVRFVGLGWYGFLYFFSSFFGGVQVTHRDAYI